jgi:hypothetical protein
VPIRPATDVDHSPGPSGVSRLRQSQGRQINGSEDREVGSDAKRQHGHDQRRLDRLDMEQTDAAADIYPLDDPG